jgi:polysaccharide chain length determinant protein (PEP-CTERM system associated)
LIDPQKIPDNYVRSTVTTTVVDRLARLRQEILSETRLSQIIDEMGLYPDLRKKESLEEVIRLMQKKISVEVAASNRQKTLDAFSISYQNSNPVVAAEVTNRLASLFIEDNIKAREQSVLGTTDFLTKELEDAQKDLREKADQITALKTKFAGELPESEMMHLQALNALQTDLRSEMDAVERDRRQRSSLESQLADNPPVVNLDTGNSMEVTAMRAEESELQNQMDELRKRYGPAYPDVVKKNMEIRDLEDRIEQAKKAATANRPSVAPAPSGQSNPVVQAQIAKLDEEMEGHRQKAQEIKAQIADHESQLERIPLFQQQMSGITRDYEAAEDNYKRLFEQRFSADMAEDLEVRQKGERFEILDPAQVPSAPDSPNRPLINVAGLVGGLLAGLVGALGLQILDPSVQTEREVVGQLGAPVFAEVPWLATKEREKQQLRLAIFAGTATAMMAAVYSILVVVTWR